MYHRLERGPLCRHDAAQSARTDLFGGDGPFRRGSGQLRVARIRPTPTEHSYLGFDDEEIFPKLLKIDNAHYTVPDESGLGIEVDEKRLMKEVFKFWEAPHLQRRDGSYTNW
jgi:L-alanine-DL-glutamate epimerase-like enolase superfamily enzyme